METNSSYSELAINLLCGQVERRRSDNNATGYGRNSACAECNDPSLTAALAITHLSGHRHLRKLYAHSSDETGKTERTPKKNTGKKTCTALAAKSIFTGFSKDVLQFLQPTIFGCSRVGFWALSKQENSVTDDKSVHPKIFKMQSRQGIPFFCRPRLEGECTSRYFWFFMRLYSKTTTQSTQGN